MSSQEPIEPSTMTAIGIAAVDGPEAGRFKSEDRPSTAPKEHEKNHADEACEDEGVRHPRFNEDKIALPGCDDTLGTTDHPNSSSAELESANEHIVASADNQQQPARSEADSEESGKLNENADDDVDDDFEALFLGSAEEDPEISDAEYFYEPSNNEVGNQPQEATEPGSISKEFQERAYEELDNSELFDNFVDARNGGGRLAGYQNSWLSDHLAMLKSSKGLSDEYMYLLEVALTLQEQLKFTWDREDFNLEAMAKSWESTQSDHKTAILEMSRVVMGPDFEFANIENENSVADFRKLLHEAKQALLAKKNHMLSERRDFFFRTRYAVMSGLKRDKVGTSWYPSEEGVGRLINECWGSELEHAKMILGRSRLLDAVEDIFQEFKDHTAAEESVSSLDEADYYFQACA